MALKPDRLVQLAAGDGASAPPEIVAEAAHEAMMSRRLNMQRVRVRLQRDLRLAFEDFNCGYEAVVQTVEDGDGDYLTMKLTSPTARLHSVPLPRPHVLIECKVTVER